MHDKFSMEDSLLIKGERIVIPTALHDQFLADLHGEHIGTSKNQQQEKTTIYWPGIKAEIEDFHSRY